LRSFSWKFSSLWNLYSQSELNTPNRSFSSLVRNRFAKFLTAARLAYKFPVAAEYPLAQFETALEHAAGPDKSGVVLLTS
jgi:hypothetical protein